MSQKLCWRCLPKNLKGTVKFLNFGTPTNFTVNTLKFKLGGSTMVLYSMLNDANEIANSEDPDQTAPLGAV